MFNLIEKIAELSDGCVVVPDEVWFCPDLKPVDIKLYKVLLDYGKLIYTLEHGKTTLDDLPIITVSQETLAEKVGVSDKTIKTSLDRLKAVKLIKIDANRGYKRNNHIILIGDFYGIKYDSRELKPVEREVKRVPIKRVPIKVSEAVKESKKEEEKVQTYKEKLRELGALSYTEKAIVAISKHYEMLASRFNHIGGYRSLSRKDPVTSKNWPYFEKLFNLCRDNGWDANLYLEAQFDRARKYWKNSRIKYPLPKMLCSDKAQKYFVSFLKDREEKYSMEARYVNMGAKKTESVKQRLMKEIIKSAEYLSMYVKEDADGREREEDKAVRLFHSWESYSPAYLWTIPWFHEFIKELEVNDPENKKIQEVLAEFEMINRSKKLQEVVKRTAEVVEREYKLPGNIAL